MLISDTAMIANDVPSINTGLRGLSYLEVEVTGPNRDLHSGVYGGAVANPINVLCDMISSMHDKDRRITIPGFYDAVKELSAAERKALAEAPFDLDAYKKDLQIGDVLGDAHAYIVSGGCDGPAGHRETGTIRSPPGCTRRSGAVSGRTPG